ncbi:hypothetical protein FIBSPDRAFT_964047 [Athelia psychrophila]|uniref:Uncharacterized protein n=1 Tax=Athelia psychrophila TaxID=1759441 RepID=A0A165YAK8_9AGAM|nr:hypothetical protein FIBSPDRAFT_964047 [Fibularhizoctonia sp. CBS 109695]
MSLRRYVPSMPANIFTLLPIAPTGPRILPGPLNAAGVPRRAVVYTPVDLIPAVPDVLRFSISLMMGVLLSVIARYRLQDRSLDEQERDAEYAEWILIDLEADDDEATKKSKEGSNFGKKDE